MSFTFLTLQINLDDNIDESLKKNGKEYIN